jgi:hypothetical protein
MPPPPYPYIRDQLRRGRVIPFLGAGASFGARNPGDVPWRKAIKPELNEWDVCYLPTAKELAECLADLAQFPADETRELTKVAQYFGAVIGRQPLQQKLREIFQLRQDPAPIHHYLAEVAANAPLLIVTTNYDDLIERAFDTAHQPYDKVVHVASSDRGKELLWWQYGVAEPEECLTKDLFIDLTQTSVIYKIHGDTDFAKDERSQYVISEDDYIDFLSRLSRNSAVPGIFADSFQRWPFLFIGYGLYDWNLRVVLNRIERELRRPGNIQSWAIEGQPKELEKLFWQSRGVLVYDGLSMDDFVKKLRGK